MLIDHSQPCSPRVTSNGRRRAPVSDAGLPALRGAWASLLRGAAIGCRTADSLPRWPHAPRLQCVCLRAPHCWRGCGWWMAPGVQGRRRRRGGRGGGRAGGNSGSTSKDGAGREPATEETVKPVGEQEEVSHQLEPEFLTCARQTTSKSLTAAKSLDAAESELRFDEGDVPEKIQDLVDVSGGDKLSRTTTEETVALRDESSQSPGAEATPCSSTADTLLESSKQCGVGGLSNVSEGQPKRPPPLAKAPGEPPESAEGKMRKKRPANDVENAHENTASALPEKDSVEDQPRPSDQAAVSEAKGDKTPSTKPEASGHPGDEIVNRGSFVDVEQSVDSDEDIYRSNEEIEQEGISKALEAENRLGVVPEMNIMEYCRKEWRGRTAVAKLMKKLPAKLMSTHDWIKQWKLRQHFDGDQTYPQHDTIKDNLELLREKWEKLSEMKIPADKRAACDEIFQNEDEEYSLYEAVKFLMLSKAIELYNDNVAGKEVPVFSWLLFARNTSRNPQEFMKNHLNQVGHTGGLEQVEMFLLGYAVQHTIKVYRLYKHETDEFITRYPDDQEDWPVVTLITEDDRHYNVPVGICLETSF